MGKLRSVFAVLLVVALITACAFFPNLISKFQDRDHFSGVDYVPIDPIRLEIKEELSALGKLAVISRADLNFNISESKTNMSRDQVMEAVRSGIALYTDTKLLTYSEQDVQLQPTFFQVQSDPELQAVVWLVTVTSDPYGDPKNFTYLELAIDDNSGKILWISYTTETPDDTLVGKEALMVFADIFFTGLEIEDYSQFLVSDLESAYWGDNGDAVRYRFGDARYGQINVDLNVHDHGFYVEFPEF